MARAEAQTQEPDYARLLKISNAFSPTAPVNNRDLFAGRVDQMSALMNVAGQRGQHGIIYGERGVGKTSLAAVMVEILDDILAVRINCDGSDDFSSIWQKALGEIKLLQRRPGIGFRPGLEEAMVSASSLLSDDEVRPHHVRAALEYMGRIAPVVLFLDEFDRVTNKHVPRLMADAIKSLSDHVVPATVVLVGVADDVNDLISEHQSIQRALAQIHMPRMSQKELVRVVGIGLTALDMNINREAVSMITGLSQGLPHYTHLLSQEAARAVAMSARTKITLADVKAAVPKAINLAQQSVVDAYERATYSPKKSLYVEVLLACALAKTNELGYFAAAGVREPLRQITNKNYDIPAYAQHLHALASEKRGPVLQQRGELRKVRYRFVDPLLQPFVIMRGLRDGLITSDVL
jgi:hypothetical protein